MKGRSWRCSVKTITTSHGSLSHISSDAKFAEGPQIYIMNIARVWFLLVAPASSAGKHARLDTHDEWAIIMPLFIGPEGRCGARGRTTSPFGWNDVIGSQRVGATCRQDQCQIRSAPFSCVALSTITFPEPRVCAWLYFAKRLSPQQIERNRSDMVLVSFIVWISIDWSHGVVIYARFCSALF